MMMRVIETAIAMSMLEFRAFLVRMRTRVVVRMAVSVPMGVGMTESSEANDVD